MICHMSARLSDIFRDVVMLVFPGMIGPFPFLMITVSLFLLWVLPLIRGLLSLIQHRCISVADSPVDPHFPPDTIFIDKEHA